MSNWYTEIQPDQPLMQGQIIFNCPVLLLSSTSDIEHIEEGQETELNAVIVEKDVIVLTQACDLEKGNVDQILLAEIIDSGNKNAAKEINKGRQPRRHLLNRKDSGERQIDYKLVDFSYIYTLPLDYLKSQLNSLGIRLQLNTPYAEYVSQRFGAYYSRIGLPSGISEDEIKEYHR